VSDFSPPDFLELAPEEQKAELERLVKQGCGEDLLKLKRLARDKALKREVSRALHRLRSKGLKVAEPGEARTFTLPVVKEPEQAAVSAVDGSGGRLVWLYRQIPESVLFQGITSLSHGLSRFQAYSVSSKRFDRILRTINQKPNTVALRVEPDFVRRLIYQALETSRRRGVKLPEDFLEFQDRLGPAPDLSRPHPLFGLVDPAAVAGRGGLVYESSRLLSHRAFAAWFFDEDSIRKCALRLEEAELSPLAMPEQQKRERLEQVMIEAAGEALQVEGREAWKERLIENAYVLHLLGDKELAEIALAAALALDHPESLPPLFPAMMRRPFRPAEDQEQKPDQPKDRIIIP